jgi:hypothetical protein
MVHPNKEPPSASGRRISALAVLGLLLLIPAVYDLMQSVDNDLPFYLVTSLLVLAGMAFSHSAIGRRGPLPLRSQLISAVGGVMIAMVLLFVWFFFKLVRQLTF